MWRVGLWEDKSPNEEGKRKTEVLINHFIISSCMAPDMDGFCSDLAGYLAHKLNIPVTAKIDVPWQERERLFDAGKINLCWICGLPYVRKADAAPGAIEALAAPVMAGSRYQGRPVYFSDVVVHRDSPYQRLADLQGAAWAYNEPASHSGYGVVRYALALRGESLDFFGRVVEAGAHQNSLAMILNRSVDWSAIDSTVLELETANHPEIAGQIRVIDTFGPSPIPPWVAARSLPAELRVALLGALMSMDSDPAGQQMMRKIGIARFVRVSDMDYDPIRNMARFASL